MASPASMRFQARALCAVQSDKLASTWVVGTNALREENEVRVLQYDAEQERLVCIAAMAHPAEIWDLAMCGAAPGLLMSVWSQAGTYGASLWSIEANSRLQRVADLPGHTGTVRQALWHTQSPQLALTVEEGALHRWDVSDQGVTCTSTAAAGELVQLWGGALQPTNAAVCATAGGNNVQLWDTRSMQQTGEVTSAHRMPARDVCFTAANEYRLVSCGDDCKLRVWDMRLLGKSDALLELGGHSHWVWRAQYSPFYEQLLCSASSDCLVNLYHTPQLAASSGASAAASDVRTARDAGAGGFGRAGSLGLREAGAGSAGDLDGKVCSYDEHEDSVYGLAWSASDPWLFASLSYDGRVAVNKVPKNVKYRIIV